MEETTKIGKILAKIDWTKIQDYHKKLNILWDIEDNGTVEPRIPEETDIKNELGSLLNYMLDNQADYISYGNWVIFWENDDHTKLGEVRVIFRLSDMIFTSNKLVESHHKPFEGSQETTEDLETQLHCAIEHEDYLLAAQIRDEISKISKKD